MTAETWDRDRIAAMLKENTFGYQNVPLPYGLQTGGRDRSPTARAIFGEKRIDGRSVFDLGCKYGYFCFFAEERGAKDILGVDIDGENIRKSRLLGQCLGSEARFERLNIETDNIPASFDIVLCLNVLHHLRDPLAVLDKLVAATKQTLVIELAGLAFREKNSAPPLLSAFLSRLPLLYIAPNSSQNFFITVAAIRVLLSEKHWGFARIDVVREGSKGRPIVIAHRRRINKLIVVAGVQAAGKSTLIDHLRSPAGRDMAAEFGLNDPTEWQVLAFRKIRWDDRPDLGNVILHYNISEHITSGDVYRHQNALTDIINVANNVKVVTVECPRDRLIRQFEEKRLKKKSRRRVRRRKKNNKKLLKLYQSNRFDDMYSDWYSFLTEKGIDAYVVKGIKEDYSFITLTPH